MRKRINIILGGIIAILSGCNTPKKVVQENQIMALYGVPYATYEIEGKVVNKKNQPKKATPIIIKGYRNQIIGDTIYTNNKGEFATTASAFPTQEINIVVTDPQTKQPLDSTQYPVTYATDQKGRGFYRGTCKIKTEIKIK
jgi:putative lipoprotein (rSAM/lipoprotein system)